MRCYLDSAASLPGSRATDGGGRTPSCQRLSRLSVPSSSEQDLPNEASSPLAFPLTDPSLTWLSWGWKTWFYKHFRLPPVEGQWRSQDRANRDLGRITTSGIMKSESSTLTGPSQTWHSGFVIWLDQHFRPFLGNVCRTPYAHVDSLSGGRVRVLLIEPPKSVWDLMGDCVSPPLGLAWLAAVLEQEDDVQVDLVDCNASVLSWADLRRVIEERQPDLVGATAMTPTSPPCCELCNSPRRWCPASLQC